MDKSGSQAVLGSKPTTMTTTTTTTYVQTDSTCFREIVQSLTGGRKENGKEKEPEHTTSYINKSGPSSMSKGQTRLKLHERRQYAKPTLQIPKPAGAGNGIQIQVDTALTLHSPSPTLYSSQKQISPSSWNSSSSYMQSPLSNTAAGSLSSPSKRGFVSSPCKMDEDVDNVKAMKERRLYLHSSPHSKKKLDEPELLTLFPLTSPKTV